METYLVHHGILGQRWGIRRYQNADGTLTNDGRKRYLNKQGFKDKQADKYAVYGANSTRATEIKKGAKLYRTIAGNDETKDGPKYVTFYQGDRDFYRGQGADWIAYTQGKKFNQLREKQYTLKKDLKIASREEMQKIYDEEIATDKKAMMEAGKAFATARLNNMGLMKEELDNLNKIYGTNEKFQISQKRIDAYKLSKETTEQYNKQIKELYDKFANTTIKELTTDSGIDKLFRYSQGYGNNDYTKNKMIEALKSRGYNAMSDEAGIGGHNGFSRETRQALIVFDGNDVFEDKSKTNRISEGQYTSSVSASNKYRRMLNSKVDTLGGK